MRKRNLMEEELAEDYCFVCKDGGDIRMCDFKNCLKAYHPQCVGKDPSFLESNERWICGSHSCCICQKLSVYQCYCCPKSICHSHPCIKDAAFVQVKKRTKGFCKHCLKLAILIQENIEVDSDGEKVDFTNTEAYEFLFKDYWEIIKDQERLTLADLQAAKALLKNGKNFKGGSDSDGPVEEDVASEYDVMEGNFDDGSSFLNDLEGKCHKMQKPIKRSRSKKKIFIGWGSMELIEFLESIGKDTKEPLVQLDASEIIKDYIQKNNLQDPDAKKKRNVICDERLCKLFRKKKVKYHKIYSLLESHFASNGDSGDEFFFSSEEDDDSFGQQKKRKTSNADKFDESHPKNCKQDVSASPKSHYAAIIGQNINSVYLKKSLIIDLLKSPDTFEAKVIGCFVRVKLDPNDFFFIPERMYKLGRVTGVKKSLQAYKIKEMSTDMVLCVSNMHKDVQISLLSDDDFEEDECEDLQQLAKKGQFSRPTVVELEEKIKIVHSDIMNHWINKEILKLQRLIDRANEKGWRRELFEYIDKREKLRTPEEQKRLLQELPPVIGDTCKIEEIASGLVDIPTEKKGKTTSTDKATEGKDEENKSSFHIKAQDAIAGNGVVFDQNSDGRALADGDAADVGFSGKNAEERQLVKVSCTDTTNRSQVIDVEEAGEVPNIKIASPVQIIDLFELEDRMWHYIDPSGNEQGPFDMVSLRFWMEKGFFDEGFKVWRTGQSREDAILLTDALHLCQ